MNKKILVVDDERSIRGLLQYKLSGRGFEVVTAKNDKEFWNSAWDHKPDLIILDIWLKDRIGTDVYENLVRSGFDPAVPVIFITALIEEPPKPSGSSRGKKFALYSKPFDFERLVEEINFLLSQKEEDTEESLIQGELDEYPAEKEEERKY